MNYEIIAILAPWAFFIASLIFIIVAAFHIKHLRQKDLEEQIALGEQVLNEKYDKYSDDDVVTALNDLERSAGTVTKKE